MTQRANLPIGDTLRAAREKMAMTQGQLAERVGVTEAMIGHIENGRRNPTLYTARKIAVTLGMTLDDLVADIAEPIPEPA